MDMFDRLEDTVNRYEDITAELGNPDVVNDQNRFRKLMKEQSSLAPLIAAYTEYKNCKQTIEDSLQLLDEESDEELKELAKEELNEAKKRVEELENEIKILLLPKDPNDDKDIIVEIRAGAGGDEAALFAAELFRMYTHYVESKGWKVEVVNADETGIGGMKEIEFMVKGQGAYSVLKYESGAFKSDFITMPRAFFSVFVAVSSTNILRNILINSFTILIIKININNGIISKKSICSRNKTSSVNQPIALGVNCVKNADIIIIKIIIIKFLFCSNSNKLYNLYNIFFKPILFSIQSLLIKYYFNILYIFLI